MNEGYSDFGMSDDEGELPRRNRYGGVPCPNCGAEFPTLWLLERHADHCGRSSATARHQFMERIMQAQAKRMAGGHRD